jgi:predicted dinucleotide-binding enzyme
MIGTRNVAGTLMRMEADAMGNPPFSAWQRENAAVGVGTFAEAAAHGEMVLNCTAGMASLEALKAAGEENLKGKVLVDVANPLDFSRGRPPSLSVCNTDSLGEQIQRALPEAKVVKTLNTVTARLMVDPGLVADGEHSIFVSGNDEEAKASVVKILEGFGWRHIVDLGGIASARGMEMWLPLWLELFGVQQTPMFNLKVVR